MYRYQLSNNHYVVEIDGYHFIIDTGYPYSITFRNDLRSIRINDYDVNLIEPGYRFNIPATHQLVGYPVDGLLGLDAFGQTGLTFYKEDNQGGHVDFASHDIDGDVHHIVALHQGFAPLIKTNDNKMFLVDTGARYSYGVKGMFDGLTPFNVVTDYNPYLGNMRSPIYHVSITLNEKEYHIDVCYNERAVSLTGVNNLLMVGNITDFFQKECCINYRDRKIIFN